MKRRRSGLTLMELLIIICIIAILLTIVGGVVAIVAWVLYSTGGEIAWTSSVVVPWTRM